VATRSRLDRNGALKSVTCADCYFRQHGLCALALEHPCPTFRAAGRILEPPHQPRLVPRAVGAAA
jgi:hypothetical protein